MGASKRVILNQKFITEIVPPTEERNYYYGEKENKLCFYTKIQAILTSVFSLVNNHRK